MYTEPGVDLEQIYDGGQAATWIWTWVAWTHIWRGELYANVKLSTLKNSAVVIIV